MVVLMPEQLEPATVVDVRLDCQPGNNKLWRIPAWRLYSLLPVSQQCNIILQD
jgi:hypothetical protein